MEAMKYIDQDTVKREWRALAKMVHPDKTADPQAGVACIALNCAYEKLQDAWYPRYVNNMLDTLKRQEVKLQRELAAAKLKEHQRRQLMTSDNLSSKAVTYMCVLDALHFRYKSASQLMLTT